MSKVAYFSAIIFFCFYVNANTLVISQNNGFRDDFNFAFLEAVYSGDIDIVKGLLELGANPNAYDYLNNSAIIYAIQGGYDDIVDLLIEKGADLEHKGRFARTPLLEAARYNQFHIAERLILEDVDVNASDVYGNTALFYSVAAGNFYLVDMLLFYGADVMHLNAKQATPLHIACWYGQAEIAGLLLEEGADIDIKDRFGNTPLLVSVIAQNMEMAWYMIESGAYMLALNNENNDIFSVAALNKDYEMLEFLAGYEVFPELYPDKSKNPASIAILTDDRELKSIVREQTNFKPKGLYISHLLVEPLMQFNNNEFMLGLQAGVVESRLGVVLMGGYESRLNERRVLVKQEEGLYYQFWEKRRIWNVSLLKQHTLLRHNNVQLGINYGIKAAYIYGSYRGADRKPESKFFPVPVGGVFIGNNWIRLNAGYEYMDTGQAEIPASRYKISFRIRIPLFDLSQEEVNYSIF